MKAESLIICATQRSGSTMVCRDCNLTGQMGNAFEWFFRMKWTQELDLSHDELKNKSQRLLKSCASDNNVRSVKVMANYYQQVATNLLKLDSLKGTPIENVFDSFFPQPTYVRIFRVNKVRQAISLLIARKTGVYHSYQENKKAITADDIPVKEITRIISEINGWEQRWDVFFHKKQIDPLLIVYENYIEDPAYHLNMIGSLVDVDISGLKQEERLKKLPNELNQEVYERYMKETENGFPRSYTHIL